MATSKYLKHNVGREQRLYESLITESIQHYGENVYYLPRTVNGLDRILNEDAESQFNDAWLIEMYPESVDGFEGQGDLMSKFGLEIRDEITLVVAKRVWERWVGVNTRRENVRPMEGDIIYLPWAKTYFEIMFVEHEAPFYQLMDRPTYKLRCSLFELGAEKFYTGIPEIDKMYKDRQTRTRFRISPPSIPFEIGERIHQVVQLVEPFIGIDGELVEWDRSTGIIGLVDIATSDHSGEFGKHEFTVGPVHGTTTGAVANIIEVYDLATDADGVNSDDPLDQSWEFGLFADDIIDFSEANPFGEVGERDNNITDFNTTGFL